MSVASAMVRKVLYSIVAARRDAARQSLLKAAFIAGFVAFLEAGLFVLFLDGFRYLGRVTIVMRPMFSFFFMGIGLMLVISGILTSYAAMYRSAEVPFMLSGPFSISQVVTSKFLESCFLSSWAMFFIVAPFIGAYAWNDRLSLLFPLWALLFSIPFVIICCGAGALVTMLFVRWTPKGGLFRGLGFLFAAAIFVGLWMVVRVSRGNPQAEAVVLDSLVPGMRLASHPALPSWWMAEGITCLADGAWGRGLLLFQMLISTALMMWLIIETLGRFSYYSGWQKVQGSDGRRGPGRPVFENLHRVFAFLPHDIRAMVTKDIRALVRDPLQWSQFLVFFGLLGIYFASLRTFRYDTIDEKWRIVIAFLNTFCMATVIASLASRFTYPQLSLEGHGFWLLGLSPTTMGRILMTKFLMSVIGMSAISVTLMLLSTGMLRLPLEIRATAVLLALAISLTVSALSTGLGAIFMDLKQQNPAAIVSGFGGTLNLILSFGYMLVTVLPTALVFYGQWMGRLPFGSLHKTMALAVSWVVLATIVATVVPLILGRRALMRREY